MTNFSRTSRTVAIVTAVVGGLVLVGIGTSAAVAAIHTTNFTGEHGAQSLNTTGITGVEVDSNSSQFTIEFADVTEAALKVEGESRYAWEMSIEGNELVVASKSSLLDFCFGWCAASNEQVTLTLPNGLSNGKLSADLTVDAGSMTATGSFSTLEVPIMFRGAESCGSRGRRQLRALCVPLSPEGGVARRKESEAHYTFYSSEADLG